MFWPLRPFGAERPGAGGPPPGGGPPPQHGAAARLRRAAAPQNTTDPHLETLCTEGVQEEHFGQLPPKKKVCAWKWYK
jgi:hypothetical protein